MRAIILAGGKGTRLAPYTTILPKPLMPVGDMAILEIVIRQLGKHGFDEITLAVGHLAELIMAYCGDGSRFNVKVDYSRETSPLGTAGPIALVKDLHDTFLVMNGDLLTTLDLGEMYRHHQRRQAIATLATYQRDVKVDLGVIELDADDWLTGYIEKPTYSFAVSTGIYLFEPEICNYIPRDQRLELPELIIRLKDDQQNVNVYHHRGYWLDIGRQDDYEIAVQEFSQHRSDFL